MKDGGVHISMSVRFVVDDEAAVLLDIDTGVAIALNEFGARVWERLALDYSVEEIEREIVDACGADEKQVTRALATFVESLVQKGLVSLVR